jgi:predicted DCC family thiol-disulfide oxidoreductase YuxK
MTSSAPRRTYSGWTVVYDADCGFCSWLLALLLRWDRPERLRPVGLQRPEVDGLLADLTPAQRNASWHLVAPSGERHSGGAAVAPLLGLLPAGRVLSAAVARLPSLVDSGYRWTAEHRTQLSKCVPATAKRRAQARVRRREPWSADFDGGGGSTTVRSARCRCRDDSDERQLPG